MSDDDDDKTITELGRAILKYMHQRMADLGQRNASYRKTRIDMLKHLGGKDHVTGNTGRFNWGFETVFAQELHLLEDLGLISVKYGSGAIMAGRTVGRKQIYGLVLTDDGFETAKVIIEREGPLEKSDSSPEKESEEQEESKTEGSTKLDGPKLDTAPAPSPDAQKPEANASGAEKSVKQETAPVAPPTAAGNSGTQISAEARATMPPPSKLATPKADEKS